MANPIDWIPVLPESAPFTPEQRAYLNGFFAGLFSRTAVASAPNPVAPAKPLRPLSILFGSQTGTAETLANRAAKEAGKQGFATTIFDLARYPVENLKRVELILLITSTFGDGEPPDNAKAFAEALNSPTAPQLPNLKFSVLSLGDSNYPQFCACGKNFDERLEQLGAQRLFPRTDCDLDYEEPFQRWLNGILESFSHRDMMGYAISSASQAVTPPTPGTCAFGTGAPGTARPAYHRDHPFPAQLVANRILNGPDSPKETRHFEISLEGSQLSYEAGDALGVFPKNCPALVNEIIAALDTTAETQVSDPAGNKLTLGEALLKHYEITRVPRPLLKLIAECSGDATLQRLTAPDVNGELDAFLRGREIIDLLLAHPQARLSVQEFVMCLKKLQPRLYSISSSPKASSGRVHLTVAIVRYESLSRARKGVCSSFLADRTQGGASVPVFIHANKNFRPPADGSRPMIMVGPGTGIAPFRAFLQERKAIGASGKNWLFFGEWHEKSDLFYRDELHSLLRDGLLTHLHTAFSRDQEQKIYVQHRMLEHAGDLFDWLEAGAHFYVCGDASRMARDVDAALHQVIQQGGGKTSEEAASYVERLKSEKRYQRDVY